MKRVFSSYDRIAAHHARNLLASEGIDAIVKNDLLSSAMGELPPAECQAEVWVSDDADQSRAERILKFDTPAASHSGMPWRCAGCNEDCEPQFTQCWRCGAERSG